MVTRLIRLSDTESLAVCVIRYALLSAAQAPSLPSVNLWNLTVARDNGVEARTGIWM